MRNLLFTNLRRDFRYYPTYLMLLLCIGIGCIFAKNAVQTSQFGTQIFRIESGCFLCTSLAVNAYFVLLLGREQSSQCFRRKVVAGYSRAQVYCGEMVSGMLISILTCICVMLPIVIAGYPFYAESPSDSLLTGTLGILLVIAAVSVYNIVLCMMLPNPAVSAFASILLVFGLYYLEDHMQKYGYTQVWEYLNPMHYLERCTTVLSCAAVWSPEKAEIAYKAQRSAVQDVTRYFGYQIGAVLISVIAGKLLFQRKNLK